MEFLILEMREESGHCKLKADLIRSIKIHKCYFFYKNYIVIYHQAYFNLSSPLLSTYIYIYIYIYIKNI